LDFHFFTFGCLLFWFFVGLSNLLICIFVIPTQNRFKLISFTTIVQGFLKFIYFD